ncbi:uncharacterized protein AFUA_2G02410 [Aspergillus fumigatus Af293]|uniref:Uncharacterized protein n=2 Tax=Aspergillus fumigatus TaxID=746128 RepID=Q4WIB7_ASPFU|nr:hypothetical protein AFUA_2G02410 [Aspergillus fumigatus Af293]EAL87338.1 hypothetical protein AFUA_2G02410 [Aspergillus fumigatus Af293]EDP53904.1 hypothetical protein AFUB_019500 [Aspergillus fumigatus A1163]
MAYSLDLKQHHSSRLRRYRPAATESATIKSVNQNGSGGNEVVGMRVGSLQ